MLVAALAAVLASKLDKFNNEKPATFFIGRRYSRHRQFSCFSEYRRSLTDTQMYKRFFNTSMLFKWCTPLFYPVLPMTCFQHILLIPSK